MTEEIWKPVGELPYEVSNLGRVRRSLSSSGPNKGTQPGRVLVQCTRQAYARVHLSVNGKCLARCVHRLVAEAFIGPRPAGADINHKNGIKADNRDVNLEYCTRGENMRHAISNNLVKVIGATGESNPSAKLTAMSVRSIRELAKSATHAELGLMFGVSRSLIGQIVNKKIWVAA